MKWVGRTYRKPKVCVVCGAVIPCQRRSYCSDECWKEALRRRAKNDRLAAKELGIEYEKYIKERK